jgi:hypothetical protein
MTLAELEAEIRAEFPKFKVVPKSESGLMEAINAFLLIVSFGQAKSFMTGYATTIGTTVYVTPTWPARPDADKAILLRHERVHMRQAKRYTRLLFSLLYLLPFLPVGLAWFRARFELEAYEETIRATYETYGRQAVFAKEFRDRIARQFTGPGYMFMWPFPKTVDRWILDAVEKVAGKEQDP